jgi:hypothetical protein
MAKESEKITRVDVRIPNDIYSQIEHIAIETNQPIHHRSGKPVVTPIIVNLLSLGLEAGAKRCCKQFDKEDFNLESLTDKQSGTNRIKEAELEKKILASLEEKLEAMIENKIRELLGDKVSDNKSDSKNNNLVEDTAETIRESGRVRLCFSYEEAVEEIKRLNQEGFNNTQIANELRDRYYTKRGSTTWSRQQIGKILKESNKT